MKQGQTYVGIMRKGLILLSFLWVTTPSLAVTYLSSGSGEFSTIFPLAGLADGDQLVIQNGHTLTVNGINDYSSIANLTITIQSGGVLELNDILGLLILGPGSQVVVDTGGQVTTVGVVGGLTTGISILPDGVFPPAYSPLFGDPNPLNGPANITAAGTTPLNQLYSIVSGNWNTTGTWSSTSGGTSCGCVPTATDLVFVQNGNTVSINGNVESAGLTILSGGRVQWTATGTLSIRNSGSITVETGGFLDENGQTGANVFLDNTAAVSIVSGGDITLDNLTYNNNAVPVHMTNSSSFQLSSTLFIGANADITNSASGLMTFLAMDAGNNNFTFNNSGTVVMGGDFLNMAGTENINNRNGAVWNYFGATFAAGTELYCDIDGANTFIYTLSGAQDIITPQDSYWHLGLGGSGAKSLQGNINIKGDLNITDPASLAAGTNGVTFNGTVAQNITLSAANSISFYNLTLNNTSGAVPAILVGANVVSLDVSNTITFIQGVLDVTNAGTGLVYSGPDITAANAGDADSFVDGPFRVTTAGNFVFPVGDGNKWARIGISGLSGSETFTASYINSVYPDVTVSGLNHVSGYEYWLLDRAGTQSAAVTLYWEDGSPTGSDITDITSGDLVVARYNTVDWVSEGQGTITGTTAAGTITTAAAVTNFSPFTFGSLTGVNPLPINLTSFTGRQEGEALVLTWETASEINNDFFTLERSYDGAEYKPIGTLPGSGTTRETEVYYFNDYPAYSGIIYYRLSQTDFDGTSETFPVIGVNYESRQQNIQVFPNPVAGKTFTLLLPANHKGKVLISIYSLTGTLVFRQAYDNPANRLLIDMGQQQPAGIYLLQVDTQTGSYKTKLYQE